MYKIFKLGCFEVRVNDEGTKIYETENDSGVLTSYCDTCLASTRNGKVIGSIDTKNKVWKY